MTVTKLFLSSFILVTYYFPRILKYHHQHRNAFQSPTLYLICRIVIQSLNHYWWVYCQWCIISKIQYNTVTKILSHFNNRHYTRYFELSYSHQTIFHYFSASVALFLIYSTIQSPNHISPTISQSQLLETTQIVLIMVHHPLPSLILEQFPIPASYPLLSFSSAMTSLLDWGFWPCP